jgi:hypothetical protein
MSRSTLQNQISHEDIRNKLAHARKTLQIIDVVVECTNITGEPALFSAPPKSFGDDQKPIIPLPLHAQVSVIHFFLHISP